VRSFIEPDLFDNNVPFDITALIYLISLLWKLGLELGLDLELHYFSIFSQRITKTSTLSPASFTEGNILLNERTQAINNKIKLHILGVPINKLDSWLIAEKDYQGQRSEVMVMTRSTCVGIHFDAVASRLACFLFVCSCWTLLLLRHSAAWLADEIMYCVSYQAVCLVLVDNCVTCSCNECVSGYLLLSVPCLTAAWRHLILQFAVIAIAACRTELFVLW